MAVAVVVTMAICSNLGGDAERGQGVVLAVVRERDVGDAREQSLKVRPVGWVERPAVDEDCVEVVRARVRFGVVVARLGVTRVTQVTHQG